MSAAPDAPPAFHVLAKPTGAVCNLDCTYCFFLSKETLYPGSRVPDGRRPARDLHPPADRVAARGPEVTVAWQGGEPTLMGLDFFRRAVASPSSYLRPGQRAVYTIQTNGTLLDDEWCAFFKRARLPRRLCIDGPRELHDAYRVDKGGKGPLRRGDARARRICARTASSGTSLSHGARGERRPPARGLPVLPRRARRALHPVHPDRRARRPRQTLAGARAVERSRRDRPLYVQEGNRVTDRSVGAEQ